MSDTIAVRTRFYDDHFRSATADGIRQVVILASGLDARAYRLSWPAGTVVYELDMPRVLDFKTTTLRDMGATPTATHHPIAVDLRDDWPSALREAGFDASVPSAWSAEGLVMYLPPEAQDRLFDYIGAVSAPGSRLAADHLPPGDTFSGTCSDELKDLWDRMGYRIELDDLVYHGERRDIVRYLENAGWTASSRTARQLFDDDGIDFPVGPLWDDMADVGYVSARR